MDSLLNSITIDPAERRKTQNRLAKRKSRIHAGNQGAMEAANAPVGRQPTSVFTSTQQTIREPVVSNVTSHVFLQGITSMNGSAEPPNGAVRLMQTATPLEEAAEDYSHTASASSSSTLGTSPQTWHGQVSSEDITYTAQDMNLYPSSLFTNLRPGSSSSLSMQDSNAILCSTMTRHVIPACPKDNFGIQGATPGSPLHIASAMGHLKVVKTLITYGANVNEVDAAGYSPIHYATRNNHTAIVALLLENGADVYSRDPEGCTPLFRASQEGNNEIVERLLKHGAQVC
ncbi:ankyrin repeat domain-containing protein [Fusarium phyllophilum]|uniref:Ankyrin repeat domain-containing protein n=1 Tax=Fusarium phyllophilum TaxID=47803 RepID=A0A8H5KB02_9HYPO|nr:ankyrin repeat domain-containing protein [Fusarium phyllophilum]